jgi:hypothetical protein
MQGRALNPFGDGTAALLAFSLLGRADAAGNRHHHFGPDPEHVIFLSEPRASGEAARFQEASTAGVAPDRNQGVAADGNTRGGAPDRNQGVAGDGNTFSGWLGVMAVTEP